MESEGAKGNQEEETEKQEENVFQIWEDAYESLSLSSAPGTLNASSEIHAH